MKDVPVVPWLEWVCTAPDNGGQKGNANMTDLEQRIQDIEDRAALERVLQHYYAAVDSMRDLDGLLDCFTSDAVFDVEDLGLPVCRGHEEIRRFFAGVFAETVYHVHHVTNFRISRLAGDEATAHGYVFARAEGRNGVKVVVHCKYDIEYLRTPTGWKIRVFDEDAAIPLGGEVGELHAHAGS